MTETFERRVLIEPGYDYRDEPGDKRGAQGLMFRFILVGPLGAISWHLNTGWMQRPLAGAYRPSGGRQARRDRPGVDSRLHDMSPSAGAVSSHMHTPNRDWLHGPTKCDVIGGECYGDTGYLIGDEVLTAMFTNGHEGIWVELETIYTAWITEPTP